MDGLDFKGNVQIFFQVDRVRQLVSILWRGTADASSFRVRQLKCQVQILFTIAYTLSFLFLFDVFFVVFDTSVRFLFLLFSHPPD